MRRRLTTILAAGLLTAAATTAAHAEEGDRRQRGYADDAAQLLKRSLVHVGKGGTLMGALNEAEVPAADAHQAVAALRGVYDPRRLRPGQSVTVLFEPAEDDGRRRFAGLEITPDSRRSYRVARGDGGGFESSRHEVVLESRESGAQGTITSSLSAAAASVGVSYPAVLALINVFAHEVDFQRDIQPGDRFELLYEENVTADGRKVGFGRLLYGALELSGRRLTVYRFTTPDGRADYFDGEGQSVRRSLLATPIDGARLTSGFGMRRHPLLGYSKMHMGTDFGAPAGTPIYAAGAGVVDEAGVKGAYGNYIRIRHDGETATAYAHLSRYAAGVRRGSRVDQGDVIGYVGSTGRSTGPHLHYEVLLNGRQVDPRSLKRPSGERLAGRALTEFIDGRRALDARFAAAAGGGPQLAAHRGGAPRPMRKPVDG